MDKRMAQWLARDDQDAAVLRDVVEMLHDCKLTDTYSVMMDIALDALTDAKGVMDWAEVTDEEERLVRGYGLTRHQIVSYAAAIAVRSILRDLISKEMDNNEQS